MQSAFLVCRMWAVERSNELLWKTVVFRRYADFALLKPAGMSWRALAVALSNDIRGSSDAKGGFRVAVVFAW